MFQSHSLLFMLCQFTKVLITQTHALCFAEINNKILNISCELQDIVVLNSSHKTDITDINMLFFYGWSNKNVSYYPVIQTLQKHCPFLMGPIESLRDFISPEADIQVNTAVIHRTALQIGHCVLIFHWRIKVHGSKCAVHFISDILLGTGTKNAENDMMQSAKCESKKKSEFEIFTANKIFLSSSVPTKLNS